ncbi:MAG TPA: Nramp family divalent metal transporter, partial [Gemmatimonadales bacterium]|nr:Nramp family divalent metal transporter [Gemmatimonadales bacterium]
SVGYMDPGNWATDLEGGARFGYQLLWVLVMSNAMAVLLQTLSARLGIVFGRDLAQACRETYPRPVTYALWVLCEIAIAACDLAQACRDFYPKFLVWPLWILCEIAIVACDLAEVLGAAVGLQLLFGIPLLVGVIVTALDVLLLLVLSNYGVRRLEAFIIMLVVTIGGCFAVQMVLSQPDIAAILHSVLPRDSAGHPALFGRTPGGGVSVLGLHTESLFIAMGILGATVMPHNLYLHSSIVQTRRYEENPAGKRIAVKYAFIDSTIALSFALFINAAILVVAAATFHQTGHTGVAEIQDAYQLLSPLLGVSGASAVFALALLASGQNSTLTGTLAGQIVMEGFLNIRLRPWLRRLITRAIAIVPAAVTAILFGASGTAKLLILSQVVLSLQLSFAVFPLVRFTSEKAKMGEFVNPMWLKALAYAVAIVIAALNVWLIGLTVRGWLA